MEGENGDRDTLAREKERAEIAKLKAETATEVRKLRLAPWTTIPTFVVALATLAAAIWQGWGFFETRKERHQFEIDRAVIDLVNQLGSDSQAAREGATLLLSAYGEHAIPVLLWSLRRGRSSEPVISSLRLIRDRGGVRGRKILEELQMSAREAVAELQRAHPDSENVRPLVNHLRALVTLGTETPAETAAVIEGLGTRIEQNAAIAVTNRELLAPMAKQLADSLRRAGAGP